MYRQRLCFRGFNLFVSLLVVVSLAYPLIGCSRNKAGEGNDADGTAGEQIVEPVISFSDVAVSVELHDSFLFATTLRVEGNVTNETSKTISVSDLPMLLNTYQDDVTEEWPTLGNLDGNEKVYDLAPGESSSFYYLSFPSGHNGDWEFKQRSKYELRGLDGVADDIESKLDSAYEEHLEHSREETERKRAENEAKMNRCFVTPNGSAYHRVEGCRTLSRSDEIYETTVDEAKAQGYVACDVCC